ncbi:unnamed protein product [Bursaphelenchus xylophilus]|uniref:(pine wood nematode) hypothetical protein n=1 Tax=Bursaphelenchus xylophilus TaxID=6326 RepID=A0A1I7SSW2_BURXY|nr:unnamed protein product [Bursaphelenchus xylophilus]CAG9108859.1 unnamed protein product [Bursaphelenchus xylophilus]
MAYPLILLLILIGTVNAKYRLCPNDGQPKTQEDGTLIQCLPGQNSVDVCGKGYSCFFSGFNYQCCPSNEEEAIPSHADCPRGAMAVLDSSGYPVKCSTLGIYCPKKDMFCFDGTESPFCCEYPHRRTTDAPIPREAEEFFKDDDEQLIENKQHGENQSVDQLECPAKSLTILGDDGKPLSCQQNNECPSSMYCYGEKAKICCENGSAAAVEPANSIAEESTSTSTTSTSTPTSTQTTQTPTTTRTSTAAAPATLSTTSDPQQPVRIHAVRTATKEPTYKQHPNGGYSINSQPRINQEAEKKEIAQHYLLEQIKRGWPYDDRYYRPENMVTVKQNGSTAAFVHFN